MVKIEPIPFKTLQAILVLDRWFTFREFHLLEEIRSSLRPSGGAFTHPTPF